MRKYIQLFFLSILTTVLQAQVGIGTDTPKAALEVNSATSGILIPRMTATEATAISLNATDHNGMLIYITATGGVFTATGFWYYDGNTWKQIGSGTGGGSATSSLKSYLTETTGTEITVSTTEQTILTQNFTTTSDQTTLDITAVINLKSALQSVVPEIRLEVKNSGGTVLINKTVKQGLITTPTVELHQDISINGALSAITPDTYTVTVYATQPACCNIDNLSFITAGVDTKSFVKSTVQ